VTPTLDQIKQAVHERALVIDAPEDLLATYNVSKDLGYPHIEETGGVFAWIVRERGQEYERRTTRSVDELLYWVFAAVTFSMATKWELQHRIESEDGASCS
jgi:hypothetical protein